MSVCTHHEFYCSGPIPPERVVKLTQRIAALRQAVYGGRWCLPGVTGTNDNLVSYSPEFRRQDSRVCVSGGCMCQHGPSYRAGCPVAHEHGFLSVVSCPVNISKAADLRLRNWARNRNHSLTGSGSAPSAPALRKRNRKEEAAAVKACKDWLLGLPHPAMTSWKPAHPGPTAQGRPSRGTGGNEGEWEVS